MLNQLNQSEQKTLEVLLVDDHPVVRLGFASLLEKLERKLIIYEAADADKAIKLCTEHNPDVALVDLSLTGKLSLDLIKQIRVLRPDTGILVVSMHDERIYAKRALRAGAHGYVMKHNAAKSIVQAVRCISEGGMWFSEEIRGVILGKTPNHSGSGVDSLSDRELEVFVLIGHGLKKSQISRYLNISESTVETYRSHIKRKLGISNGVELHRQAFLHAQGQ